MQQGISQRADVKFVYANAALRQTMPKPQEDAGGARAAEWGVTKIRAPEVWAAGARGAGVVVAGQDKRRRVAFAESNLPRAMRAGHSHGS